MFGRCEAGWGFGFGRRLWGVEVKGFRGRTKVDGLGFLSNSKPSSESSKVKNRNIKYLAERWVEKFYVTSSTDKSFQTYATSCVNAASISYPGPAMSGSSQSQINTGMTFVHGLTVGQPIDTLITLLPNLSTLTETYSPP